MLITPSMAWRRVLSFRSSHKPVTNAAFSYQFCGRRSSSFGFAIFKQSLPPMGRFRNNDVDSETLCKQASEDNCIGFPLQDHRADPHRDDPHRANNEAPEYAYFVHEQALLRIKGV